VAKAAAILPRRVRLQPIRLRGARGASAAAEAASGIVRGAGRTSASSRDGGPARHRVVDDV